MDAIIYDNKVIVAAASVMICLSVVVLLFVMIKRKHTRSGKAMARKNSRNLLPVAHKGAVNSASSVGQSIDYTMRNSACVGEFAVVREIAYISSRSSMDEPKL